MKKLFIIDGSAYAYRSFYAIRSLTNSKGQFTNAVYGFDKTLRRLIEAYSPSHLVVAFDAGGKTFRHEKYNEYKAQRKPMPDELVSQIPLIKEMVLAHKIPLVEIRGVEADDIMASLAQKAKEEGFKVTIVSGDKDMMQMVDEDISMLRQGKTDTMFDIKGVEEHYGVKPHQIIDFLSIVGDSSDNIPGVPGAGEKTAAKLLQEYGSIENILKNIDNISKPKIKKSFTDCGDKIKLNQFLVTVKRDIDVGISPDACVLKTPEPEELLKIYKELEFKGMIKELTKNKTKKTEEKHSYDNTGWEETIKEIEKSARISIILDNGAIGIGYEKGGKMHSVCFGDDAGIWDAINVFMQNKEKYVCSNDLKTILKRGDYKCEIFDVSLAAYLLDPAGADYSLESLSQKYLDEAYTGKGDIDKDALKVYELVPVLEEKLKRKKLIDVYKRIELPLIGILAFMENKGIKVDASILKELSLQLGEEIDFLTEKIYGIAGEEFNINSHKDLEKILFTKLNLPKGKRTKTGYSTDVDVLTELKELHELPGHILEYRQAAKLKSTYIDPLPQQLDKENQRLHTTFNQTITATGRLSSTNPNLQNIPIKTDLGKRIRKAFIPGQSDWLFLSADYSQMELRILAHMSRDKTLIKAFNDGVDIHTATAKQLFGEEISETYRRQAKIVNFGIIYGMGPRGLAKSLGIQVKEAKQFIDTYLKKYPGVARFMEEILDNAKIYGYVSTMFGRKRIIPELTSFKPQEQAMGERIAINTPIQGSAADIVKIAMINICKRLCKENIPVNLLLQIHDELLFELPPEYENILHSLVKQEMEQVVEMSVPLCVDIKVGKNWAEL